jgi:polyisoprenoid-binding protein YceI
MKSFIFKEALAQDHFNENYVESDKFPKASFKGNIMEIGKLDLTKEGKYIVSVEGDLTIHGKTNKLKSKGTLEVKNDLIIALSKFEINIYDYGIKIPKIVQDKVNKIIPISVEMKYKPYNK